jgi:hypothetical protein
MKEYFTYCKKDLQKTNSNGILFDFQEGKLYECEILNIDSDNFCAFFYDKIVDTKCKILQFIFEKYFCTQSEHRKKKLEKITNIS